MERSGLSSIKIMEKAVGVTEQTAMGGCPPTDDENERAHTIRSEPVEP